MPDSFRSNHLAALATFAALLVPAASPAQDPIREHGGPPRVESVGDTARAAAAMPDAGPAHAAARDTTLAAMLRDASRVRLLMEDAVRYEGERALTDSGGLAFNDAKLTGLRFAWHDIATIEVSRSDRRWAGAVAGGALAVGVAALAVGPTLDEEGLLSGMPLDALRAVTYGVSAALGGFIGYELGRSARRWEHVYP